MKLPRQLPALHRPRAHSPFLATAGTLVAMIALFAQLCPQPFVAADACPPAQWQRFRTPTHENLLVLPGSDIDCFALGGLERTTLYAIGTWNSPCANNTPEDPFGPDGMLFDPGQAPRLWKSTDGGFTWQDRTEEVLEARNLPDAGTGVYDDFLVFTAVAAAPDDPDFVIVAGYNRHGMAVVVGSSDGADTFSWLGCNTVDGTILCASVSPLADGRRDIAVGTADAVNGGRIWRYEAGRYWTTSWTDAGSYAGWADTPRWDNDLTRIRAVTSVAFSPGYREDRTVLAVVIAYAEEPDGDSYEGFYLVGGTWNPAAAWNVAAGFEDYPVLVRDGQHVIRTSSTMPAFLARGLTDLALPADFNGDSSARRTVLVSVNGSLVNPTSNSTVTEGGFLFWVQDSTLGGELLGREGNPWAASIAYHGASDMRGRLLVGTSYPLTWTWSDVVDWFDSGSPALPCCGGVGILFAEDNDPCCPRWNWAERPPSGQFNAQVAWSSDGAIAYASTSGSGRLWTGADWYADEGAFSQTPTPDGRWEQTGLIDTMIHHLIDLAYDPASMTLHLHSDHNADDGSICNCESIWRTTTEGKTWVRELHGRPDVSDADEEAFDDILGAYYRGFYKPWTEGYLQAAGVRYLIGDAIDDDDEQQVQEGFQADAVYRLIEGGDYEWKKMSQLVLNYEGLIHMKCNEAPGAVLYAGFDNLWWDYTANEPLPYKPDGSDPAFPAGHDCRKVSGAARCLDPGSKDCCGDHEWDYLIRGLRGTADPDGVYEQLFLAGANCAADSVRLWAIDNANYYWAEDGGDSSGYDWCTAEFINNRWGRLWVYDDCYALTAVTTVAREKPLTIPPDPCGCTHAEFILEWERTCDACEYEVQIAFDRRFTHIALETEAFVRGEIALTSSRFYRPPGPEHPSLVVPKAALDVNQTYWWRARAHLAETDEVISSWWSAPETFHTAPGPPGLLELRAPADGSTRVPVKAVAFTWTRVSGATRYDFMLVDQGQGHVASQVDESTYFVLPLTLAYDTPYIWRVIALDGDRAIAESPRATFRTEPEPVASEYIDPGPTLIPPSPPAQHDWVWYFVGILALLLAAMLGVLSRVNRRLRRGRGHRAPLPGAKSVDLDVRR